MPVKKHMCNNVNYHRAKGRPNHVENLSFNLNHDYLPPGFLRGDIYSGDKRHLIFMTQIQMNILKASKTWYMDGTFRVIRRPFTQLFGIHAYVSSGTCMKQLTVAYIFMSMRNIDDYTEVFRLFN